MTEGLSIPQLRFAQQPCRARAPFVRFADISPADGGICPLHKGAFFARTGPRLPLSGELSAVRLTEG